MSCNYYYTRIKEVILAIQQKKVLQDAYAYTSMEDEQDAHERGSWHDRAEDTYLQLL
jgi:hypothetical protein